jgi:hypothetical protein
MSIVYIPLTWWFTNNTMELYRLMNPYKLQHDKVIQELFNVYGHPKLKSIHSYKETHLYVDIIEYETRSETWVSNFVTYTVDVNISFSDFEVPNVSNLNAE